jgi:serine/threonine protein kinase
MLIGSCAYMSAERFSGGQVGPPADIYALTCLLYECLTGRPPFEAGDLRQLMSAHMFSPPPRPSIMKRGINRAFDDVIAKGMAKDPAQRFSSTGELAKAATAAASSTPAPIAAAPTAPQPPSTRQFSAVYPNPAATGYTPYPPAVRPPEAPKQPKQRARFSPTQVVLAAVTIVMLGAAAVLTAMLVSRDDNTSSPPQTTVAGPPPASTTTETTTETATESPEATSTTSTTPTTPTTSATSAVPGTDGQGFVGHTARCDAGSSPAALVRTANSLAVVCESGPGTFYYRGERLRDGANIELPNAVRSGGGFDVVNPADGTRYEVRPDRLSIISRISSETEPVLQYGSG